MDARSEIPILDSLRAVGFNYRVWLVDIWGVMHDGVRAFSDAVAATQAFRREDGIVILISNAPRPASSVAAQVQGFGVPKSAYDAIVSSGDLTRELLAKRSGLAIYHLGPARDAPVFEGLVVRLTTPDDASLIVCTGLFDDEIETPDDYRRQFEDLAERELPMICANPDTKVERGDRLVWCAGGLGQLYEQLGGAVTYTGKPHAPIYQRALRVASGIAGEDVSRSDVLAIGDGLETDIKGAAMNNIDALFIASGLHLASGAALDRCVIAELFRSRPRPIAAMERLVA